MVAAPAMGLQSPLKGIKPSTDYNTPFMVRVRKAKEFVGNQRFQDQVSFELFVELQLNGFLNTKLY